MTVIKKIIRTADLEYPNVYPSPGIELWISQVFKDFPTSSRVILDMGCGLGFWGHLMRSYINPKSFIVGYLDEQIKNHRIFWFKNKKRTKAIIVVGLILALTSGISIFSVYHSPWTFSPSWHITNMDVKGSEWFYAHSNSMLEFDAMGIDPSLMLGMVALIPKHFNYSYHETLSESLALDSYVVVNKRCKLANADPMMQKTRLNMRSGWGFDEEDFYRFEHKDESVNKLYSNGEFDTFLVRGAYKR